MDLAREIFAPDFLLRNSVYISLCIGFACPLVGMYLILRRLIFLGVALPQVSSCGIALAFSLQAWGILPHLHEQEHRLAFFGATLLTLPTVLLLSLGSRKEGAMIGTSGHDLWFSGRLEHPSVGGQSTG